MTTSSFETKLNDFKHYLKKMKSYEEAVGLIYWDMRTGAPRKGIATRSEVVGELSGELFKMSVSDEMGAFLDYFASPEVNDRLDPLYRKIVSECRKEYDRSKKIPPKRYQEYVVLTSQSEAAWEAAKEQADFAGFQPYLEKIVDMNLEFIDLWGYKGHKYNTLLDMYEPGMTVEKLDQVFGALREKVVPLLTAIQSSPHKPDTSFLKQEFDKEKQKRFSLYILEQMGYDFEAGRLDETVHPFATGLNPGDVRITTRYLPDDVNSALFGTIHEGGHALYEQNISPDLIGTPLCTGTSMGIHESQSRFWENMIGRSRPFWTQYYGKLQNNYPGQFDHVAMEDFYRATNEVKPSLIRIEADELTYNLHIMVRYEIEKALFSGSVKVADLPEIWNEKYRDYLGVVPAHNGEGVLQDVHWSGGAFGYFPSYALGNMYAAQIMRTLRQDLDLDALIREGNLHPIKDWLTDKIYRHGKSLTPTEIITQVTGEELNPDYLVDYLREKYSDIYRL
ncbi:carboxypeptidase M32 [Paenibacillus naphthalenovorans]|uniref:Metal-dependent carboxypeptidase n=1 Tax=Paenibacillus naphthalenovorans TaxID=162209 RepID=A0A0U2IME2_9BACL|nr:carboxypeptidase M32 [Paenibacillus naphthalenovorans]ALS22523.1 peptidase M32 [Paenibacillus naphthalenovorans]SDH86092.1 carboxypeptidase Taq [Paenibacillus naphthalenovorans]